MKLANYWILLALAAGWTLGQPGDAPAIEYRQLTFFGSAVDVDCSTPAWSADALQVAFTHVWIQPGNWQETRSTIVIVRASDGSDVPFASQNPTCSPGSPLNSHPSFSPDASKLAFQCNGLWIGALAETLAVQLGPAGGGDPDWSPDGTRIAFVGDDGIFLVPVAGGSPARLTAGPDKNPAWSRDGAWIAFASSRAGSWDIWIVPSAGGEPQQVTSDTADEIRPSWSPDGSLIVFDSDRSGNHDLWVVRVANSSLSQVTEGADFDGDAAWSPDGRQIAFVSNRSGTANVWIASELGTVGVEPATWSRVKRFYR